MSEQRRLQKRLSDMQARFNVVIDEIEKVSEIATWQTQDRHLAERIPALCWFSHTWFGVRAIHQIRLRCTAGSVN